MSAVVLIVIFPNGIIVNIVILSVIMLRVFLVKIAKLNLITLYCFITTECCYNECIMLGVIFPSGIIINLVILSVIMLRAVLPGIAKLNVITLFVL
jgi:hypothetical protein